MKKLNICFAILTSLFCIATLSVINNVYRLTDSVDYLAYDLLLLVEIIFSVLFIILGFKKFNYKNLIIIQPILTFMAILLINVDYSESYGLISFANYYKGLPIYYYLILIATTIFAVLGYKYKNNIYTYINIGINSYFIIKLFYCFYYCANSNSRFDSSANPYLTHLFIMVTFILIFVTLIVYSLRSLYVENKTIVEQEEVKSIEE